MQTVLTLLLLLPALGAAQQYSISTVVGGSAPATPVPAAASWVGNPDSVSVSPAGEVYFTSLNAVFKVDKAGALIRVAGTTRQGYSGDGGLAVNAQLSGPAGVAVDATGTVYIADSGNNRIRRITSDGIITTFAGGGSPRIAAILPAPAVSTFVNDPAAVAIDRDGSVLFAEFGTNLIRRVSPAGVLTTVASSIAFFGPSSLAVDSAGNIYVADSGKNAVRKIAPTGTTTTIAGTGTSTPLNFPDGVSVDASGNIFIADSGFQRIVKVSASGAVSFVAGSPGPAGYGGDNGPATSATLYYPNDVAVDSTGAFYIADSANGRIRRVGPEGTITTFAGNGTAAPPTSPFPTGVAVTPSGDLYFTDSSQHRLRRLSTAGVLSTVAGTGISGFAGDGGPASAAQLATPYGVAADSLGNIYVADAGNNRIRMIGLDGTISTVAGDGTAATLGFPMGVAVDAAGSIYIAEASGQRICKLSGGALTTIAGTGKSGFLGDGGLATAALVKTPTSVAVALDGTVYFGDTGNNAVRSISGGKISTVATATSPNGVAVDPNGILWYSDTGGNQVLQLIQGISTPVAGFGFPGYSGDSGTGASALLNSPTGLAFDGAGNAYVVDSGNAAIRMLKPIGHATTISAVYDAAAEAPVPLSPGKMVVIYGTALGPATLALSTPTNGRIGTDLGGTKVSFNGIAAPLVYTSASQVLAIVPYGVTGKTAQVVVSYGGDASPAVSLPLAASAPAIFTANATGAGAAAAINIAGGVLNTAIAPAHPGEYVAFYATGEGATSDSIDGQVSTATLPAPKLPVSATVGGLPATVQYAGGVPGVAAGLMQVNVLIPATVKPGGYVPVSIQVGTASSQPGVWISVAAK
jgi:uncharacterized protein (TIGR03437 family)